ncbi:hypothetical protein BJ166DRAFT_497857 [Pestalotiopsis sp. NC0098]|nr:hypothetical protein BJ166DRAFT_497857 [Pestalotiopsis sp. NC0098]
MRRWFSTEVLGRHADDGLEKGTGNAVEPSPADHSEKGSSTTEATSAPLQPQVYANPFSNLEEKPALQHKRNASASHESRWERLQEFHLVFLVDDAASMRGDWAEALSFLGEALPECLRRMAGSVDSDGNDNSNVSVFFTNRWTAEPCAFDYAGDRWRPQWPVPSGHVGVRHVTRAAAEAAGDPPETSAEFVFEGVVPADDDEAAEAGEGGEAPATGMARRLGHILRPYVQAYTAGQAGEAQFKHIANLDIIVVTNGLDGADVQTETLAVAADLNECGAPTAQVGLQFVQVGDSEAGGRLLRDLDSDIVLGDRDMIDTVRYAQTRDPRTGRMTEDGLYKVLLGGVSRKVDMKKLEGGHFLGKK